MCVNKKHYWIPRRHTVGAYFHHWHVCETPVYCYLGEVAEQLCGMFLEQTLSLLLDDGPSHGFHTLLLGMLQNLKLLWEERERGREREREKKEREREGREERKRQKKRKRELESER